MPLNYIPLYVGIWSDKKFRNLPDADTQLLFIYLFSNPSIGLTGIYELDTDLCKLQVKLRRDFEEVFNEIVTAKMILWDKNTETIFVINRYKLIRNTKSPKIREGVINELNIINHSFKNEFLLRYQEQLKSVLPLLKEEEILLNEAQVKSFIYDLKWDKERIKKFYIKDRCFAEQKVDEIIQKVFPNLK